MPMTMRSNQNHPPFGKSQTGLERTGLEWEYHFELNCQNVPGAAGAAAGAAAASAVASGVCIYYVVIGGRL